MTAESPLLLIETPADGVRLLKLNRPEKRNALATALLAEIADAIDVAVSDDAVRCVIVTGSDRLFAAGADIGELQTKDMADSLADVRPSLWQRIRACSKPLLAAVEGWSLGAGNELVMCCDIVVAGRSAKFGQPETNLGIIPGAGGTATLPRLVGRARAMKMVLLGDAIDAEEARAAGLVSDVVADGAALDAAIAMAVKIAGRAPLAMRQGKASVRAAFETHETAHLSLERQAFSLLSGTRDKGEGVAAFLEKRSPAWSGR
jgi:enoyl-CoA hydratase